MHTCSDDSVSIFKVLRGSALFLVLTLLILEVFVRVPWFWTMVPQSSTGIQSAVSTLALRQSPYPEVVFMGGSRLRSAISPTVLADTLGVEETKVVNLSYSSGTPLDFLNVYRANRSTLQSSQLLVVGVAAWQFNWSRYFFIGTNTNRFRQQAGLIQRAQFPNARGKIDLMAGWFWRSWDARYLLRGYIDNLNWDGFPNFPTKAPSIDPIGRVGFHEESGQMPTDEAARLRPHDVDFNNFQINEMQAKALADLVSIAKEDGLRVVLVEPPQSPVTLDEIAQHFRGEDALWRQVVEEISGLPVNSVHFDTMKCVDWKACYVDYGHLNIEGSTAYSQAMGRWLLSQQGHQIASWLPVRIEGPDEVLPSVSPTISFITASPVPIPVSEPAEPVTTPSSVGALINDGHPQRFFEDPEGLLSVPIPDNWVVHSLKDYGLLTDSDGNHKIYVLVKNGKDIGAALDAAWTRVDPGFELFPIDIQADDDEDIMLGKHFFTGVPISEPIKELLVTYGTGDESIFVQARGRLHADNVYMILAVLDLRFLRLHSTQVGSILSGFTINELVSSDWSQGDSVTISEADLSQFKQYVVDSMKRFQFVPDTLVHPENDALLRHFMAFHFSEAKDAIFGDSHLQRGLEGIDGFINLAWSNENFQMSEVKIVSYFSDRDPGKIIIDVSPHMFNYLADERGLGDYPALFLRRLPQTWMFLPRQGLELYGLWQLFVADKNFRNRVIFQEEGAFGLETVFSDSDETRQQQWAHNTVSRHVPQSDFTSRLNAEALRRTLSFLKSKGATVCMVRTPVTNEYLYASRKIPEFSEANQFFELLAMKFGFSYLDMSDAITDQNLFADPQHLNKAGAEVFSDMLVRSCFD